ncbi:MAG TPA: ATP-binding protein [Chitinophagaceae bacterium]|jgi:signal transduction histidine kinase|nr:ATP-binding protein [Chitinophagaceae bacterium]
MNEIIDFFAGLFSTKDWPPRWKCGTWSDFHGWLYIASELMVWTAYFLIPLLILNYIKKKKAVIGFRRVYLLFATFILLCGSTHFLDALMFWVPMYRFNALVRLVTGMVSLATVYHLMKILPKVFRQKTRTELEQEITRREEAERKLAEANRDLQAFAYIASHDLQEPLRKISTYTSMLEEVNRGKLDERSTVLVERVKSATKRMQALIDDVLTLSTLQGEVPMHSVPLQVPVQRALEDLQLKIESKNARVTVESLPSVRGNEAFLAQLFQNLVNNALKFSDRPPEISISATRTGDRIQVAVTDNGIGIREEDQERIFGAFQRLHGRTAYEGTGIGLAICQKIADLHGGAIRVESRVGEGTTFYIELQAAPDQ